MTTAVRQLNETHQVWILVHRRACAQAKGSTVSWLQPNVAMQRCEPRVVGSSTFSTLPWNANICVEPPNVWNIGSNLKVVLKTMQAKTKHL